MLRYLNLYKEFRENEGLLHVGLLRSLLFYLAYLGAMVYILASTLAQPSSTTDVYTLPSISTYLAISSLSPSCPCAPNDGSYVINSSLLMNATANWTTFRFSARSSVCAMISLVSSLCYAENYIAGLCPLDNFTELTQWAEWNDLSSMNQMCLTMAAAQDTLLSGAQASTIQLSTLITPAALSSQLHNFMRTSLQFQGLAWGQVVFTANSVSSLESFPLGRTFASINLTQDTASALGVALNKSLQYNFQNIASMDELLNAGVGSMFRPLENPSFFRPVNFSELAPDIYTPSYGAYFASCAPIKCDVTRLLGWQERLFSAVIVLGGFGAFLYNAVLYIPLPLQRASAAKVGVEVQTDSAH